MDVCEDMMKVLRSWKYYPGDTGDFDTGVCFGEVDLTENEATPERIMAHNIRGMTVNVILKAEGC